MGRPGDTRTTIQDAMAMVAAAAVGVTLSRWYYEDVTGIARIQSRTLEYRTWVYLATLLVLPFAAALAWCRLRRPCRPARRLAREPGLVALLATGVSVVFIVIDQILMLGLPSPRGTRFIGGIWRPLVHPAAMLAAITGPAVCAAWSVQWLAGYWRPTSGWIDHASRALGTIWVIIFAFRAWFLVNLWP
jgi:hypothetical protein